MDDVWRVIRILRLPYRGSQGALDDGNSGFCCRAAKPGGMRELEKQSVPSCVSCCEML
jgi:hypothetical protein